MQDIIKDYVMQSFRERKAHALELIDEAREDEDKWIFAATEGIDVLLKYRRMLPKGCYEYWLSTVYPNKGRDASRTGLEELAEYLRGLDETTFDEREVTTVASGLFDELVNGCLNQADKALLWKLMESQEPEVLLSNDIIFD